MMHCTDHIAEWSYAAGRAAEVPLPLWRVDLALVIGDVSPDESLECVGVAGAGEA